MNIIFLIKPKCDTAFLYTDDSIRQGLEKIHYHKYTAIPVIDHEGIYHGTITEGDFLWHILGRDVQGASLSCDIRTTEHELVTNLLRPMFNPPVNIYATMDDLLQRVMDQNFVPVVDDRGVFVGIITRKDVIGYFVGLNKPVDPAE
ncbi:CBS domain-containing protein [Ruminococcus sp.]|uniref:CBS domain-containing protein n=1 Tax=Ruminococcus sp. TaxID=41978 RepID=UPI0025D3225C|nr:CBS domain-containing protein [Ruminococcus sp.]